MTNPPTPEDKIDEIIVLGFLYGIESERLTQDEVDHRVAGFKHTQGFKEARHALLALLNEKHLDWLDKQIAHVLEDIYPLDVFPRKISDGSTQELHVAGIYHGLHILRREARELSAREDLAQLPQETEEYYAQLRAATPKENV